MNTSEVARLRLHNQGIGVRRFDNPADVVRWFGAVQAQELLSGLYGIGLRMPEATEALTKAAQLNPQMASKAYFNMGANLVNSGSADKAS